MVVLCIVGIEIGERLAFYGISANLVTYLTHVLHEGTEVSATNVNNWIGATFIAPLLGAFLADAFWGRFWTILIFGTVYFVVSAQSSSPFTQPALPESSRVSVSSNVSAMSHSRHSYSECLGNVLK